MSSLAIGQIVQLKDGRKGEVRFIGSTEFSPEGIWVGVELSEPLGKNDGSVAGISYFLCEPNHGLFARPGALTICEPGPPTPAPAPPATRTSVPAPARRASRPSSLQNAPQSASDTTIKKRTSLNAPSPSPVSRGPRPSSMTRVRVSVLPPPTKLCSGIDLVVTNKVPDEGHSRVERLEFPNEHSL